MKTGKLSHEDLQDLVLKRLPPLPDHVVQGPGIALDCAAIRFKDGQVLVSSDPITGASADIGRLCVHIACNDIAACGIRPSVLTLVLIAPPDSTAGQIAAIVDQAAQTAQAIQVTIAGGHTEVSDAVNRFVLMATAIGFCDDEELIRPDGGQAGDTVLMTKTAGIEGTAIFAKDQRERLAQVLDAQTLADAARLIDAISVIEEGVVGRALQVHAMHDATEGGILGACWELAEASQTGCVIDQDRIPVDPLTRAVCAALAVDPYRLIASGSLILASPRPQALIDALAAKDIRCTAIGTLTEGPQRLVQTGHSQVPLAAPGPDQLYKIT